ncbi:oligosaccharide flippase family protein [Rhizobium helianthi]|uniref:Oligosaccharide flippase family protein n=1 Tax=Rhizobium helianthi TaxID=1132695 RepID=A0ABW4M8Y6_9HYPH
MYVDGASNLHGIRPMRANRHKEARQQGQRDQMRLTPKRPSVRPARRYLPSLGALTNFASLVSIQAFNAFAPLIAYPFVLAVVGQNSFAEIVVAEAITLFLLSFVLYSFEVDGVAAVVGLKPEKDSEAIAEIFVAIIILRLCFYCSGLLMLQIVLTLLYPDLRLLVLGWSLVSLSYALQPNWLFQGLEHNLPLAVFVTLSRIAALATVFLFIRSEEHAILLPFILGGWYVAGAIGALSYSIFRFGIQFRPPPRKQLIAMIWHGKEVFLSGISTGLYRDTNVLILSILGVPAAGIASYSLAEKLTKALQAAMRPLNQFFFPRALAVAKDEGRPSFVALKRIAVLTLPQMAFAGLIIGIGAAGYLLLHPYLPALQKVHDIDVVFHLTLVMSLSVIPGVGVFMLGIAGLNALGARTYLLLSLLMTAGASIGLNLILIPHMGSLASAVCFVFSESLLLALIVRRYWSVGNLPTAR